MLPSTPKELFDLKPTEMIKKHLPALFILIFMGIDKYNAITECSIEMQIKVMVFLCTTFLSLFIHGAHSYRFTEVFEHILLKTASVRYIYFDLVLDIYTALLDI